MTSKIALAYDIESYGIAAHDWWGQPLPQQQTPGKKDGRFHPIRSLRTDGVPLRSLILTASITLCTVPPTFTEWNLDALADIEPGPTIVFDMHRPTHLKMLSEWFKCCGTIMGMNLGFDLPYSRVFSPLLKYSIPLDATLIDASVCNYLQSEIRTARSLKTMGPVLKTHSYDEETQLKEKRYPNPRWKNPNTKVGVHEYNGQDTHNTILAIRELARRIRKADGDTPKLSPYSISFYSELLWSCVRMAEAGIPMSRGRLSTLMTRCMKDMEESAAEARTSGLLLNGKGSKKSKDTFIMDVVTEASAHTGTNVLSHPMLKLTDKKKEVSWSDQNRLLLRTMLPPDAPSQKLLKIVDRNSSAQKLIGSYILPLLHHKANDPDDRSQSLIPHPPKDTCPCPHCAGSDLESLTAEPAGSSKTPSSSLSSALPSSGASRARSSTTSSSSTSLPDVGIAYPTIYLVPTSSKDTSDEGGGQQQGRISFKKPAAQTFPKPIKECVTSRFGTTLGCIRSYDLAAAELRVAAVLSGEPSLVDAFNLNLDPHAMRAVATMGEAAFTEGLPTDWQINDSPGNKLFKKLYNTPRQCFKHANFTDLNWGSADTLRRTILKKGGLLVSTAICEAAVASRSKVRPVLWKWQNEWVENTRRTHICLLPFTGQSRSFSGLLQGNDVNECVNFPIQCLAANTMIRVQSYVHRALASLNTLAPPCHMFLNCYDALYFDTLKSFVPTLDKIMADAIAWVTTQDYWHMICQHYGHTVPLAYEGSTHA